MPMKRSTFPGADPESRLLGMRLYEAMYGTGLVRSVRHLKTVSAAGAWEIDLTLRTGGRFKITVEKL